jgi:hypothetical protein
MLGIWGCGLFCFSFVCMFGFICPGKEGGGWEGWVGFSDAMSERLFME